MILLFVWVLIEVLVAAVYVVAVAVGIFVEAIVWAVAAVYEVWEAWEQSHDHDKLDNLR